MKRKIGMAVATAGLVAAAFFGYQVYEDRATGTLPKRVFENMKFPDTLAEVTGDEKGMACVQIRLRTASGDQMLASTYMLEHDFRTMTEAQKRKAVIERTEREMKDVGLACTDPDGKVFLHQTYAQPHCESCGGGCGSIGCPATIQSGGFCTYQGPNCIIVIICCGGGACTCG